MPWTANVLVVANLTVASPELFNTLVARAEKGSATFTVVVPATAVAGGHEDAAHRLELALERLREAELEVNGHVGDSDPIVAVSDEWDPRRYDEIVLCTLPMRVSKWLRAGLPERVERLTGARVTHIVSQPPKSEPAITPAPTHEKHGVITPLYGVMATSSPHSRGERRAP